MDINPEMGDVIVNMNTVKSGFFDILSFIANDEENSIQLEDAVNVLQMVAKLIESAGVR